MKKLIQILILCVFPIGAFTQWSTNLSSNLQIASNGSNLFNLYSGNGYFFCYDENVEYKIHRYNTDGTPNWASPMLPNNRPVGSATFTKYAFLDNTGNLIHISSFDSNGNLHYCINKISANGNQLWNGSSGIEIDKLVLGAYLSPNNDLYVAKADRTLQKYNASGVLQWTTTFADGTFVNVSNVSISEKANGSIGLVFFKMSSVSFVYGNYYYSDISDNGTLVNTIQIETELCRFYSTYKLLTDNNDLFFLFTDQNDKAHVQKITSNAPLYPVNGFDIDILATQASIYQSAIIKNGQLHILYHYYELVNGPIGIKNQTIDLTSFSRNFANGNILLNCNNNDVFTLENGMINHDSNFGFLVIDKITKNLSYKVSDGNTIILSQNVCTSPTEKGMPSLSTLNNINSNNSQIVILLLDDRNNDFSDELYAQNLLFGLILGVEDEKEVSNQIEIFPNPTHSTLFIKSGNIINNIEIYNAIGQLVFTFPCVNEFDTSNWKAGTYFLKITTENDQIFVKNIIKE